MPVGSSQVLQELGNDLREQLGYGAPRGDISMVDRLHHLLASRAAK
jgi:hypothetical protein